MSLGWITFCTMKTLSSYIILMEIFYQLLIKRFSFSRNIYLTINNMIVTNNFIMMFLPCTAHSLNCYFEFINPSCLLNNKPQFRQFVLKRDRKQLYRKKIKSSKFFTTNNQQIENIDEVTHPITTKLQENWYYLFKNNREMGNSRSA